MHLVEPRGRESLRNRPITEAKCRELLAADDTVLLRRDPCDLLPKPSKAGFRPIWGLNPAFDATRAGSGVPGGWHGFMLACEVRHGSTHRLRVFGENAAI
jgi:hypothetical protein